MYFLHRLAPASAVYNVPLALRVGGPLDVPRLAAAVEVLRHRHQALRTTVEEDGARAWQVVHPPGAGPEVPLRVREPDGSGPPEDPGAWAARVAAAPFDLARGPLWRVEALRISPEEHAVVFAFHHMVLDEAAAEVLAEELRTAYADPEGADRAEPPHGYADFCAESAAAADEPGAEVAAGLAYWRTALADLEPLPLPAGGGTPQPDPFAGDRVLLALDEADTARVEAVCRAHRVSPFMVFHTVLAVLLERWTGAGDIVVGTPVGGRTDPRYERTVGLLQNTVVLRDRVTPDSTFRALLTSGRRTVLTALQHQDVPFETVVDAVRPAREAGRNPLFQVALVYNRAKVEGGWALDGLTVEPLPFPWHTSHFDLSLTLTQDRGTLTGDLTFRTARLDRATVEELAALVPAVLARLADTPDGRVADVPVPASRAAAPPAAGPALAEESGTDEAGDAPVNDTERVLVQLFEEVLGVDGIGRHDDFFALGGHSLLAVQLAGRATAELGRPVEVATFMAHPTVASLAAATAAPAGPVRLRPGPDGATVALVHPVGGTLTCYRELTALLPPGPDVLGLERVPGTHPAEESIEEIAGRYARSLSEAVPPERPLTLAGWSAGGLLAYAVAVALRAAGRAVERVVVVDGPARRTPAEVAELTRAQQELRQLAKTAQEDGPAAWTGEAPLLARLGVDPEPLRQAPAAPTARLLTDWAELLGALAAYRPPATALPVTLLCCTEAPEGQAERITDGWRELTAELTVHPLPGDHLAALGPPAVARVAEALGGPLAAPESEREPAG